MMAKETFDEVFDYQWDSLDGYGEEIYFSNSKTWVMQRIEGIIYIPQNLKVLEKSICIATVEFYPGSKQYDYLCPYDAKIGEIAYIKSHGEQKEVHIISLKNVYEDETSLPINKKGKLNKGKNNSLMY